MLFMSMYKQFTQQNQQMYCWIPKSWPSSGKDGAGCLRVVEMNAEVNNSRLLLNAGLAHVQSSDAGLVQPFSSVRTTESKKKRTPMRVAYIDVPYQSHASDTG